MILKIQPYATDKSRFGEEYNAHCQAAPPDSCILLLDWDCMLLSRESYRIMERAIERYPDTAVFGAMTNRISYSFQRRLNDMDENDSIRDHIGVAEKMAQTYPDGECFEASMCAGFFMLFKRSYWEKVKFQSTIFDSRGRLFDENFSRASAGMGLKVRIIKGIYCFHQYRMMSENYRAKDHLKG